MLQKAHVNQLSFVFDITLPYILSGFTRKKSYPECVIFIHFQFSKTIVPVKQKFVAYNFYLMIKA